jgi:hypothetical protein
MVADFRITQICAEFDTFCPDGNINNNLPICDICAIHVISGSDILSTMKEQDYKHADITQKIIGAAMKVHSTLGNGFQEVIYQRALAIEMDKRGLKFQRELEMPIYVEN